jgi:REP element-mobilizing transposase RayT
MANSYAKIIIHFIFSTKNRQPLITKDFAEQLWSYMAGIAQENKMLPLAIGGMPDHAHVCAVVPPALSVSKAVQFIKGGSSAWVHENLPELIKFKWQVGYSAFSIGQSTLDKTINYIQNQEFHHSKTSFQEEYRQFLNRFYVPYDEKYLWG